MSSRPQNVFLASLDGSSFAELTAHLAPVLLHRGQVLYNPGDRVDWVYFPVDTLLSLVTLSDGGAPVESAMVGIEGAAGMLEACGSGLTDLQCLVQADGQALRAPAHIIRDLATKDHSFARRIWTLLEFQVGEARQSALCHATHTVEHRMCRWLVEASDRSGGRTTLPLTQELLGIMLGVQRTTVTEFSSALKRKGLISYKRGQIHLDDLGGLEQRACECHAATTALRERLDLKVPRGSFRPVEGRELENGSTTLAAA